MELFLDMGYKSLLMHDEELCGDQVAILKTENSKILIVADGMGKGVRANIFSTLTSKILGTMISKGLPIDEAVETIAKTLPLSSVNNAAYCTFSVLQLFTDGRAYIAEYDNPLCICLRDGQRYELPFEEREIAGKTIRECTFRVCLGDTYIFMSDGALYCGGDQIINYAWDRDAFTKYALKINRRNSNAKTLACKLTDTCGELYLGIPTDDTTVAVAKVDTDKIVHILTGPPKKMEDDSRIVADFMQGNSTKIVCGGTSSEIVARELGKTVTTDLRSMSGEIPPMAKIDGIDLVTEGIVTLLHTVDFLHEYNREDVDPELFVKLDEYNGASKLTNALIDDCTHVVFYVGTASNIGKSDDSFGFDISTRHHILDKLVQELEAMGRDVEIRYY